MSELDGYYDMDGNHIGSHEFSRRRRANREWVRVGSTRGVDHNGEAWNVSTVLLGLDHGWGDGPPIIFETLVFGSPLDGEMERYATKAQAVAGHDQMVMRVKEQIHDLANGFK